MNALWKKQISCILAGIMIGSPCSEAFAGEGLLGKARSRISGVKRATEYNHVEKLAMCIDKLEEELLEDGTVVAKAPDIWGEARLTAHRAEFEEQFQKEVGNFEVRLNGTLARSDQAFLASALMLNASLTGGPQAPLPSIDATQINNMLPAVALPLPASADGTKPATTTTNAMTVYPSQPGSLFGDLKGLAFSDSDAIQIEQTIELDQMARYLNHLHEIRRMNEGDDTADSPGYSLNLVRIPVSILPGSKTRIGHAAEITVTAEAHVTDELLPTTFRALVINDLVDQLSVPVVVSLDAEQARAEELEAALESTKDAFRAIVPFVTGQPDEPDLDWLTIEGFADIVSGVAAEVSPNEMAAHIAELKSLIEHPIDEASLDRFELLITPAFTQFCRVYPQQSEEILPWLQRIGLVERPRSMYAAATASDPDPETLDEAAYQKMDRASRVEALNSQVQGILSMPESEPVFSMTGKALDSVKDVLDAYESLNTVFGFMSSSSGHRRARSPLSGQNIQKLLGDDLSSISLQVSEMIDLENPSRASAVRNLLRDELENAYETLFDVEVFAAIQGQDLASIERSLASGRGVTDIHDQFSANLETAGIESGSLRSLLAWPILIESLLLSRQLNSDIKHVSKDPDCGCMTPGYDLPFYGMEPSQEARNAFVQYVKCRWPIHVFALDPMTQDQNIVDQYAMRREMQLAMALAVATGKANAQSATRYTRRLEMDMETVALNRTAVAFGHGKDTFGWRFSPRVQTPNFESNSKVLLRDMLIGGPNRDDLKNQWELEPGMRECVAVVLMPSFITHVRFDCRGHFLPLACDRLGIKTPADTRTSVYDTVEMSRMIRDMQNCAMCAMNESQLYRDGEVDRLMRRVEQLSDRLPLQTTHSRVPNENTLGGFEMFSSGVTDLAPELYDWYGEPGYTPGKEATIFLIGSNFSVTSTSVIVGNRSVQPTLLSREVMQIVVPKDAQFGDDGVDVHVATPYGVSQHVHIDVVKPEPAAASTSKSAPALTWEIAEQEVIYRWAAGTASNATTWDVADEGILLPRPHELVVKLPEELTKGAPIPQDVTLNVAASLELQGHGYIVLANATAGLKYSPDRKGFVLEGAPFIALHTELKTKLVAKLKALEHKGTPPIGPQVVTLSGFITPTSGANPRVEIAHAVTLRVRFAPDVTVATAKEK